MRVCHPLEGRSLELFGWMRRRRRLELIVVLADGSHLMVPAGWTDLEATAGPEAAGTLGSLDHLLAARRVLDGVLRRAVLDARDDPAEASDAVAFGSGGVTGAGGGVVGAGGRGAAPRGDGVAGRVDRADGRWTRRGGAR